MGMFFILILSFYFLAFSKIAVVFAVDSPIILAVDTGWNSDDIDIFNLPDAGGDGDASYVLETILDWLLTIVGFIALVAFIIAGIQYFFVATDEKMEEKAKKTMTAAIIGLFVALMGMVVIYAVDEILNAEYFF